VDEDSVFSFSVVDIFSYLFGFQRNYLDLLRVLPPSARQLSVEYYVSRQEDLISKYTDVLLENRGSREVGMRVARQKC
jgi:hypothetical protein